MTTLDQGFRDAAGKPVLTPLMPSWMGRADAPPRAPKWARFDALSEKQLHGLISQLAFDQSAWDYNKIGNQNQLGRYQFSTQMLEAYGLLAPGSTQNYGINCVNYRHCWKPVYKPTAGAQTTFQNYFFNTTSMSEFLSTPAPQECLAYQRIVDLYLSALKNNTIKTDDSADVVGGMIYVCWTMGVNSANAWRYHGTGQGVNSYNSGRYAITNLSN